MPYVRAFVAGFVSTLTFHQAVIWLFVTMGVFASTPWNLTPVPPLGIPSVLQLAFWGGLWGLPIWYLMRHATGTAYWVRALVFGAIGPTTAFLFFFYPLKHDWDFSLAWQLKPWIGGLIVNGVWGLGFALLMRVLKRVGV